MSHKANDIYREQYREWEEEQSIEDLAYKCYCWNREQAPEISPERWLKVFPKALEYEERRKYVRAY